MAAPTSQYMLNPLTQQNCAQIDQVLQNIPQIKATLVAMQACDLPCQEQMDAIEAIYERCTKIKAHFNPLAQ